MNLELKKKKKGPKKKDEEGLGAVMRGVRDKLNPTKNPYEKSNITHMKNPMEISQICRHCCCCHICLAAIARSNPNGLRLTWVCVEGKFFGLFMEFSGILMEFSGEERGKRRQFDR